MTKTISRTARQLQSELKDAHNIRITYKELGEMLETKVSAVTQVEGATPDIIKQITEYRENSSTAGEPKPAAKATKVTKTAKRRGSRKPETLTTSNRPPRITRTEEGAEAATELMKYLEQFDIPESFPINWGRFRANGIAMVRGTTVDGKVIKITQAEAIENLGRRDDLCYAIPLFSENVQTDIVTRVAKLDGAPTDKAEDENGMKLYSNRTAWYYNLLQIGIRIWAGYENPPSLDLKQFPHREFGEDGTTKIRTVTFRYRSAVVGLVSRIKEAFEEEVLQSHMTGSKLREFRANWIDEFIAGDRKAHIGPSQTEMSFRDFRINGRQGKSEEFKTIWDLVESRQLAVSRPTTRRSSSTRGR